MDIMWTSWFNRAYDCIGMRPGEAEDSLKKGISTALSLQKAIVNQAAVMLERLDSITRLKCFRYAFVSRSAGGSNLESAGGGGAGTTGGTSGGASTAAPPPDSIFGRPAVLSRLAHFLMDVQVRAESKSRRRISPPLHLFYMLLMLCRGKTELGRGKERSRFLWLPRRRTRMWWSGCSRSRRMATKR